MVCLALWLATGAAAADDRYYYYDPDGVGAHAFYNPWNFIVQGGLGALYDTPMDSFDWSGGFATLNKSLGSPLDAIHEYGWGRFIYREFTPHPGAGQNYVPNWVWHFTGGGMRTKLMEEYYRHLGLDEWPARIAGWASLYSMHYLNEAVQAARFEGHRRTTIDPLSDMYFFDWTGALMFQFDAVNRFMSRRLHQREWSYQAQYDPLARRLLNNGQLYWMRVGLYGPVSLSFLTGEQITSLNLTYSWDDVHQISVGAGPKSKAFIARNNGDTDASGIVWSAGVYYSVNDNPFVVFTYEPSERHGGERHPGQAKYMVNCYPGLLRVFDQPAGMSLSYQLEAFFVGFAMGPLPMGMVLGTR
ncbi:MAG: hypothetical protein QM778_30355 [Myxococcales bacterium]